MMTKTEIKKAVRNGANLLRKHEPDWFNKLDFNILNLRDGNNCILAQVFGGFKGFGWAVENIFERGTVPIEIEDIPVHHSNGTKSTPVYTSGERWGTFWSYCMCDHGFEPWDDEDLAGYVEEWQRFVEYLKKPKNETLP